MADLVTQAEVVAAVPSLASRADLGSLIGSASRAIEKYCHRIFEQATVTDIASGQNLPRVWLSRPPIVSITSVTVNGDILDNTHNDAWVCDPDTGELVRGNGLDDPRFAAWFPKGFRNVSIVYVGGYSPIPDDVKQAAIVTVKHFADARRVTGIYKSESLGDYSYTLNDISALAVPPAAELWLSMYVRELVI